MPIRPSEDELLARLKWFVKLRWLFLLGLAAVLFSAVKVFHLKMEIIPIIVVAGLVLLYNTAFYLYHRLVRDKKGREFALKGLRVESNLQIGSDLLALVFLVHFTGGIENPFIFFFIFHMIMGSILLFGRDIWYQAIGASSALMILLVLSYFQIVPGYLSSLRAQTIHFYLGKGVLLRPLGNVVYILPPYCITREELHHVYDVIHESLSLVAR